MGRGFLLWLVSMHIVQSDHVYGVIATLQRNMRVYQYVDSGLAQRIDHRCKIVIAHDAENSVAGPDMAKNLRHGFCRFVVTPAKAVPVVPGKNAQVNFEPPENVAHGGDQIQWTVGMQIAHMHNGVSVKGRRKIGEDDVECI